ncbi:hypothetical protein BDF14DRAFT_1801316 [Spinellus fusiger]|nr:hypothetical protein BDF14DRAFT_1801316 [Spinellus fusiger]
MNGYASWSIANHRRGHHYKCNLETHLLAISWENESMNQCTIELLSLLKYTAFSLTMLFTMMSVGCFQYKRRMDNVFMMHL